jgi:putative transposase
MDVFHSDADRQVYLTLLVQMCRRFGVTFWGWCLMTNHIHLIAVPSRPESLARGIGEAHRRYTTSVNEREGVRGHLFQERFFSYPIETDSYFL